MNVDDPRHGTKTGYNRGCRDECCTRANMRALKRFRMGLSPKLIDPTGTRRRIQALMALGWTYREIAERAGGKTKNWTAEILKQPRVTETTARTIAAIYDDLSMTVPEGPFRARTRAMAAKRGWPPPLAFDDIDRDPGPIVVLKDECADRKAGALDEVAVRRVLSGERLTLSRAERVEAARIWKAAGKSLNELERIHGWNVCRDSREESACA